MPEQRDDPTISDHERLWRRVPPIQIHLDPKTREQRVSSAAFRSTTGIISVAIASLTTAESILTGYPGYSLVEFEAGAARMAGCVVVRDPLPDDPAHALVYGSAPKGHLTKPQARKIAQKARWVHFQVTEKGE